MPNTNRISITTWITLPELQTLKNRAAEKKHSLHEECVRIFSDALRDPIPQDQAVRVSPDTKLVLQRLAVLRRCNEDDVLNSILKQPSASVPEGPLTSISCRIPLEHHDQIAYLAQLRGNSVASIIRSAIAQYLASIGHFPAHDNK